MPSREEFKSIHFVMFATVGNDVEVVGEEQDGTILCSWNAPSVGCLLKIILEIILILLLLWVC